MDWIEKIPQWIRIPIKILLPAMTFFSGFIMLASNEILSKLALAEFREKNGFAIGLIFLICACLIFCYVLAYLIDLAKNKYKQYKLEREQYEVYNQLEPVYKHTLYEIYRSERKALTMSIQNAVTAYLIKIRAIGTSDVSVGRMYFDCYLQPWVTHSIRKDIHFLESSVRYYKKRIARASQKTDISELKDRLNECEKQLTYLTTPNEDSSNGNF